MLTSTTLLTLISIETYQFASTGLLLGGIFPDLFNEKLLNGVGGDLLLHGHGREGEVALGVEAHEGDGRQTERHFNV